MRLCLRHFEGVLEVQTSALGAGHLFQQFTAGRERGLESVLAARPNGQRSLEHH
jgi:hypothetical protein